MPGIRTPRRHPPPNPPVRPRPRLRLDDDPGIAVVEIKKSAGAYDDPEQIEWESYNLNTLNVDTGVHTVEPVADDQDETVQEKTLRVTDRTAGNTEGTYGAGAVEMVSKEGDLSAYIEPHELDARPPSPDDVLKGNSIELKKREGEEGNPLEFTWLSKNQNVFNLKDGIHQIIPADDGQTALESLQITRKGDKEVDKTLVAGAMQIETKDGNVTADVKPRISRKQPRSADDDDEGGVFFAKQKRGRGGGKRRRKDEEDERPTEINLVIERKVL